MSAPASTNRLLALSLATGLCMAGCEHGAARPAAAATTEREPSQATTCDESTCPSDRDCLQVMGCALNDCVERSTDPPSLGIECVANCLAQTCSDSQLATDEMMNCTVTNFGACAASNSCINERCSVELSACVAAVCR